MEAVVIRKDGTKHKLKAYISDALWNLYVLTQHYIFLFFLRERLLSMCWRAFFTMTEQHPVSVKLPISVIKPKSHLSLPQPKRIVVSYFTQFFCCWRIWKQARGNSTPGPNPCPGPLCAGAPLVSSSPAFSPRVGAGKCSTLHPRQNYLWRWFSKGGSTLSQECCPSSASCSLTEKKATFWKKPLLLWVKGYWVI